MRIRALMVLVASATLLFISACSQTPAPTTPVAHPADSVALPGIQSNTSEGLNEGHNLLGYWQVTVDTGNQTWDVVPVRQAEIHLNVLTYLEVSPCANCFTITKITVDPYHNLDVDITLKHPYTSPTLTGFDVRAIAMFDADDDITDFGVRSSSLFAGNPIVENADGFTTLYNPTTAGHGFQGYVKGKYAPAGTPPTGTLNGYKTFFSNADRHYFSAGGSVSNTFHIVKPASMTFFAFGYAVDASWAKPTTPVNVPGSFPLTANSLEAYKIETSMSNPLAETPGSHATMTIDVYDWQGASTIGEVSLAAPYFWTGVKAAAEVPGGPGTKRFTCDLVNEFGFVTVGEYPVIIRVLDTTSAPGTLIDNIAWQVVPTEVIVNHAPVCLAEVSNPEPSPAEVITFTDTSTDVEGPSDIVESWWDWENDGTWDEQGFEVTHSWPDAGVYTVNHKVKDKAGAESTLGQPLSLDVGLFITLAEDEAAKAVGTVYNYISKDMSYASGGVIDVTDLDGPWDFTTIGLSSLANTIEMVSDTDSEVAGFAGDFNANTSLFVKSANIYDPFFPVLYQAEYHYSPADTLYVYGFHDPFVIGSSPFEPPIIIPFPMTIATDYVYDINNPGFVLTYQVKALGEGDVKVPYGGGTTYHCLLLRYKFNVSSADPVNGGTLNFAFVTDTGIVVANVIAVNDPPIYTWNTSANTINSTATVLFQALNTIG